MNQPQQIDISIIVPFYNSSETMAKCMAALLGQTYPRDRYEIIFVDNNSEDGSAGTVKNEPRIRLLTEKRPGAYAARNRGIGAATGTILAFTDVDCVPIPEWLEELSAPLLQQPAIQLVQGARLYNGRSTAVKILCAYESERARLTFSSDSPTIYFGYTNNMAVRREVFDKCGLFLEIQRGADTLLMQRVLQEYSCNAVHYAPAALVLHLEIDRVSTYLRKKFIYGASSHRRKKLAYGTSRQKNYCRRRAGDGPLPFRSKTVEIIRRSIQRNQFRAHESLLLIFLALLGSLFFLFGQWSAKMAGSKCLI